MTNRSRRKYRGRLFAAFLCLTILTSCGVKDTQTWVFRELGIKITGKIPQGEELANKDTRSGNRDGTVFAALRYADDDTVLQTIQKDGKWKPFPLDETVQALAYGLSDAEGQTGPYLTDEEEGKPLLPVITNGYYRLIDRQDESRQTEELLERYSINITLGVYDTDTDILYVCLLNT